MSPGYQARSFMAFLEEMWVATKRYFSALRVTGCIGNIIAAAIANIISPDLLGNGFMHFCDASINHLGWNLKLINLFQCPLSQLHISTLQPLKKEHFYIIHKYYLTKKIFEKKKWLRAFQWRPIYRYWHQNFKKYGLQIWIFWWIITL